jgi:hypothetical protein
MDVQADAGDNAQGVMAARENAAQPVPQGAITVVQVAGADAVLKWLHLYHKFNI